MWVPIHGTATPQHGRTSPTTMEQLRSSSRHNRGGFQWRNILGKWQGVEQILYGPRRINSKHKTWQAGTLSIFCSEPSGPRPVSPEGAVAMSHQTARIWARRVAHWRSRRSGDDLVALLLSLQNGFLLATSTADTINRPASSVFGLVLAHVALDAGRFACWGSGCLWCDCRVEIVNWKKKKMRAVG